jgi:hypothetical protein
MNTSVRREIQDRDYAAQGIGFAIMHDVLTSHLAAMISGASSALPTPTRTPTPTATAPQYAFGPVSGAIPHDDDSRVFESGTDVVDFVAEATLMTPVTIAGDSWIAGFLFRQTTPPQFAQEAEVSAHVVVIRHSGSWVHILGSGGTTQRVKVDARSLNLGTGLNATNHIRVIARGEAGWLFINGNYEAELDLSWRTASGSVTLFATAESGTSPTRFTDFAVRPLRKAYGPRDGSIDHLDDGRTDGHRTSAWLADGIVEARFFNPYSAREGTWSSGLQFRWRSSGRQGGLNERHVIGVKESGTWFHFLQTDEVDPTGGFVRNISDHISTSPSGSNHIRIIALGEEGWLFINGVYIDKLDLSGLIEEGGVAAVSSLFEGDGVAGKSTRLEDFTIWSADGTR